MKSLTGNTLIESKQIMGVSAGKNLMMLGALPFPPGAKKGRMNNMAVGNKFVVTLLIKSTII
jgi:hypothetical protein